MVAALVVTTSCGTDNEDLTPAAPSISLSGVADQNGATLDVNQSISFTLNVNAPGGFNTIRVDKTIGMGSTVELGTESKAPGQTVTSFTYPFSYAPTSDEAGKNIVFDFVVTDDNGKTTAHEFVVTVNEPVINVYQAVLMGAQSNTTTGSFYNARENQVYLIGAAKNNPDKVDFVYYYGATNKATVAAPTNEDAKSVFGATNLQGMNNASNFVRTTANFASITTASAITNAWLEQKTGTVDTQVKDLAVGQVFAFQLADKRGYRLGVAEIVSIEGASNTGKITLNIKTQSSDN